MKLANVQKQTPNVEGLRCDKGCEPVESSSGPHASQCGPVSALAPCGKKDKNGEPRPFQIRWWATKVEPLPRRIRILRLVRVNVGNHMKNISLILFSLALLFPMALGSQDKHADSKGKADPASNSVHLTIVVTNAEDKKPVDSASVYVKYVQGRLLGKDKKIEMNLKTNLSGVVHVPEIPRGKFLVQIIAPGWKTFGEYYEVDQAEQTINIELARPPKWY
jgi:hypothetical protein